MRLFNFQARPKQRKIFWDQSNSFVHGKKSVTTFFLHPCKPFLVSINHGKNAQEGTKVSVRFCSPGRYKDAHLFAKAMFTPPSTIHSPFSARKTQQCVSLKVLPVLVSCFLRGNWPTEGKNERKGHSTADEKDEDEETRGR